MRHPHAARPAAATALTAVAALAATLLAACGGGGKDITDPLPRETYGASSIRSTGAVSVSAEGIAIYGDFGDAVTGGSGFMLALGTFAADSSFDHFVAMTRERTGVPGTGTYALHDALAESDAPSDAFTSFAVLGNAGGRPVVCFATAGTLTVSSTANSRLKGSYSVRADCLDDDGEQVAETTITGTFDAVDGTGLSRRPRTGQVARAARAARLARVPR